MKLASMVGREIMDNYKIVNYYCREAETYRKIDEIEGAPIELNKHYLDADWKILTGLIEPHPTPVIPVGARRCCRALKL